MYCFKGETSNQERIVIGIADIRRFTVAAVRMRLGAIPEDLVAPPRLCEQGGESGRGGREGASGELEKIEEEEQGRPGSCAQSAVRRLL